ncbi:MAG: DinB family protein [Armatimonadota bacterium]
MSDAPVLDFVAPDGTRPGIGLLRTLIDDTTHAWRDHLGEVPDSALAWRPQHGAHSIGAVLLHLGDSESWWFECLVAGGERTPERIEETDAERSDVWNWHWADPPAMPLSAYYDRLDRIRAECRSATAEHTDPGEVFQFDDERCTLAWVHRHVATHEAYHYGQAVLLLRQWELAGRPSRSPETTGR